MAKADLTAERLRELLDYNPETGVFTWAKTACKKLKVGDAAGSKDKSGRVSIRVDGALYLAHRLAWLHVYGSFPTGVVDHIDGNPSNNRLVNLRDVSRSINQQNQRRAQKRSVSGLLGVCCYANGTFGAQINVNKKVVRLGVFASKELAHLAYVEAKRRLHEGCTI